MSSADSVKALTKKEAELTKEIAKYHDLKSQGFYGILEANIDNVVSLEDYDIEISYIMDESVGVPKENQNISGKVNSVIF